MRDVNNVLVKHREIKPNEYEMTKMTFLEPKWSPIWASKKVLIADDIFPHMRLKYYNIIYRIFTKLAMDLNDTKRVTLTGNYTPSVSTLYFFLYWSISITNKVILIDL